MRSRFLASCCRIASVGASLVVSGFTFQGGLLHAAPGDLDPTFLAGIGAGITPDSYPTFDSGTGAVNAVALQSDGKILAGGNVSKYDNTGSLSVLKRINGDGSLDVTFNSGGAGFADIQGQAEINDIVVLADDSILVGGSFTSYNGTARNGIVKLNADGTLDTAFAPSGLNGSGLRFVNAIWVQPDGKILIGGGFSTVNGTFRQHIARLNADGTLDTGFSANGLGIGAVLDVTVGPDGKVYLAGATSTSDPFVRRLYSDGTVDGSFQPVFGPGGGNIGALLLLPDGTVLVGGFVNLAGSGYNDWLVALTPQGTVNTAFMANLGSGPTGYAGYDLKEAPDGKIIVAARFGAFSGQPRASIARLNADGTLDGTFAPLPYATGGNYLTHFYSVALQNDGKIVAGGWFDRVTDPMLETYNLTRFEGDPLSGPGTIRWATSIAETNEGSAVTLTATRFGGVDGAVGVNYATANGTALSGSDYTAESGTFSWADGQGGSRTVTVTTLQDTDIEGDHGFTVGLSGATGGASIAVGQGTATVTIVDDDNDPVFITQPQSVTGIATLSVTLSGAARHALPITYAWFKDGGGTPVGNGATLLLSGLTPASAGSYVLRATIFDPQTSSNRSVDSDPAVVTVVEPAGSVDTAWTGGAGFNSTVQQIFPLADGSVVVGGSFSSFDGVSTATPNLAKLSPTGTLVAGWPAAGTGPGGEVRNVFELPNGQFLVAGNFTTYNGSNQHRGLARINADGTLDTTFTRNVTGAGRVARVLSDGSILGGFDGLGLIKFNSTGTQQVSFAPFGASSTVYDIEVLPNDQILAAVYKSSNPRSAVVYRLNSDLNVDDTFTVGIATAGSPIIYDLAVDGSGRILVGGSFSGMSGFATANIARLLPDGAVDTTFTGTMGGAVNRLFVQADGRIVVGGFFTNVGQTSRQRVARLLPDGTVDPSFFPNPGASNTVNTVVAGPTGAVYVGGIFTSFAGQTRGRIARLNGDFGSVQFEGPTLVVNEQAGTATVKVKRLVGSRGAASVQYQLSGGTATAGVDFTGTTSGTLNWTDGDATDRDLVFNLTNDGLANGTRTFTLQLFNAVYPVELGQFSTTTVSILDDESTATVLVPPQPVTVPEANPATFSVEVQSATAVSYQWLKNGVDIPTATDSSYTIPSVALSDSDNYSVRITNSAGFIISPAAALTVLISPSAVSSGWTPSTPGVGNLNGTVRAILPLPDGGAIVGGDFTTPQRGVVKITASGAHDPSFTLAIDSTFAGAGVHDLLLDDEGRLYVAGRWDSIGGKTYPNLIRLRPDGTVDDEFAALLGSGPDNLVRDVSIDQDRNVLIGGSFARVSGLPGTKGFARLSDYGAVDRTLVSRVRATDSVDVYKIERIPGDTRLFVAGQIINYFSSNYFLRLQADGTRDFNYNPPSSVNARVTDFIIEPGGGVILSGAFTSAPAYMVRLLPNASLDTSFLPGVPVNGVVNSLALQPNGRLAVGGAFTTFGGASNRYARITADGKVDGTINLGAGFGGEVVKVVVGGDGRTWVGGSFTQYKGAAANRLVRLHGDDVETGITGQPLPQAVTAGSNAMFSVTVAGTGAPAFQWFKDDAPLSNGGNVIGATSATLQISNAQLADAGSYHVQVTAGTTTAQSLAVDLEIAGLPEIDAVTDGGVYPVGRRFVLGADVFGAPTMSFQWKKGTTPVPMATSPVLVLPNPTAADSGSYTLEITNGFGMSVAGPIDVTFVDPDPAGIRAVPLATVGTTGSVIFPIPDGRFFVGHGATSLRLYDQAGTQTTIPTFNGRVDWVTRQANGGYLVCGQFTFVGGVAAKWLARLNPDFTHDTEFQANLGVFDGTGSGGVQRVIELPNGRIVASGAFNGLNGEPGTRAIVMLRPDGTRDPAFTSLAGDAPTVTGLIHDAADGSLILAALSQFSYGGTFSPMHRLSLSGQRDGTFSVTVNSSLRTVVMQPDRKLLLGGLFDNVQGVTRLGLARLNPDGTLDTGFLTQTGYSGNNSVGDVRTIALEADGDIIVAGGFGMLDGIGQNLIGRLKPDGTTDFSFDPGFGFAGNGSRVESVAVAADGSIFATGSVFAYDDTTINDVVILHGDRVPLAFAARPANVDVQPGGTITLSALGVGTSAVSYQWFKDGSPLSDGGDISGAMSATLMIANADPSDTDSYSVEITNLSGTLSSTAFATVLGAPEIREDPLGGTFAVGTTINLNVNVVGVDPLNFEWFKDGSPLSDTGNISGSATATLSIANAQKADSGSYTVTITNGQGTDTSAAASVNVILPPGGYYAGFPITAGTNTRIRAVLPGDNDEVFIGGDFTFAGPTGSNTAAARFALLGSDGAVNAGALLNPDGSVRDLAFHGTDGIVIGGSFLNIGGVSRPNLARFTESGPDTTFHTNMGTGPAGAVYQVISQPDGKVLIGGQFSSASGEVRYGLARYNADGTLDAAFNPPMPMFAQVSSMALGTDGKITVSGYFNISGRQNIARFNGDGTLDLSFSATLDSAGQGLAIQADGKVIVGGFFGTVNGQGGFGSLARLNVNGTTDVGFPAAGAFPSSVNTIAIQSNGRILVGGSFQGYGGSGNGMVRLEPDGSVDASFVTGTGWTAFADVHDIVIRDDGVIWVGGNGFQFNGQTVNYLAAFNGDEPPAGTTFASWVVDNMLPMGFDGPTDDFDLDGIVNLLEYAFGLDPKTPDVEKMPKPESMGGLLKLTYQRLRQDLIYTGKTTTNLTDPMSWTTTGVDQGTPAPDGTTTASIPITGTAGFLHIDVQLTP